MRYQKHNASCCKGQQTAPERPVLNRQAHMRVKYGTALSHLWTPAVYSGDGGDFIKKPFIQPSVLALCV